MNAHLSTSSLIKATLASFVAAGVILVTVVMPAEYNIDPTGVGKALGVNVLNVEEPAAPKPVKAIGDNEDAVTITVPAGRGVEYKLAMNQFDKVTYEWLTDGNAIYVDLHGEPEGDTTGYFESYTIATVPEMKGSFTAPFAGSHGWYFRNKSDKDIQIQLLFSGKYAIQGLKQ
ncbi:hypothetical protein [Parashewanella tropica]|uniref:hypothetical protein n=1 Tax=Parashewanella tropica TaxID=2547970 RepID=UPI00105A4C0A|nr:hypothetical protein [Parashewanella tropica]